MNIIEKWNHFTADLPSPQRYIDWTLYWTVSAALQRRVWLRGGKFGDDGSQLFAPMFVGFVADAGVGKSWSAIWAGEHILKTFEKHDVVNDKVIKVKLIPFSKDCATFEAMIKDLNMATRPFTIKDDNGKNRVIHHASLCVLLAEEMTTLFREHVHDLVAMLRQCYDCREFSYTTKTKETFEIRNICMPFLGCTTPVDLARLSRNGVVNTGFNSRMIYLYEEKSRPHEAFFIIDDSKRQALADIKDWIKKLLEIKGQLVMTPAADKFYRDWFRTRAETRINRAKVLNEYYARKPVSLQKLAIAIHFCYSLDMEITELDIQRALAELGSAELNMHKALTAGAPNELAEVSAEIIKLIESKGPLTANQIKMEMWDLAKTDDTQTCLNFLNSTTGQLTYIGGKYSMNNGKEEEHE